MEGAGKVAAVGAGVQEFQPGDRVAYCIVWGSYAEFAAVPASRVVKVPDALPLEMAAASLFHGFTAHYLANDVGRLTPGMTCLVHAASGGIGQILIQLAKRLGARVLATTSTAEKAEVARSRGADVAMLYDNGRFAEVVRDATDGRGVDVVYDPIGQTTLRDSMRAARRRGLVVNYGAVSGAVRDLDPLELGEAGSLFLTRPRLADHLPDGATTRRRAQDIFSALLDGSLKIGIAGRYTLADVEKAHAELEDRRMIGKPVLVVAGE
jgi:NADPH2:quinone reductase